MGNSFRQTVAALFAHPKMNPQTMLEGHRQATLDRIQNTAGNYILALQDTTLYNYTTHSQMKGLGKKQGAVKGILQHNVLTVSDKELPSGLIHQQYWTPQGDQPFAGSESLKWNKGLQAVNEHLAGATAPWFSCRIE